MKIENLQEGQVLKNYKELCEVLDIPIKSGNTKKSQLKELECYVKYHKQGNAFVIDEIYNNPLPKIDGRKWGSNRGNIKIYKELNIDKSMIDNIGVYYISNSNDIYIGSTYVGFRKRFLQHYYGNFKCMKHTYELLQNGGTFNILYDMSNVDDIELIRMVETEYINYFKENSKYNVINKISGYRNKELSSKFINIKIEESNYEKAMALLIENNLIENNKIKNSFLTITSSFDENDIPF